MKIDKSNPKHWIILMITGIYCLAAILVRTFSKDRQNKRIIFYGHKFNGNLRSFYNYLEKKHKDFTPYYLTMDPVYAKKMDEKIRILKTTSFKDMLRVAKSAVILTSHGSHALVLLNRYSDMKFIDVWHGVSYKGWNKEAFGEQKNYEEIWVSSPAMKDVYVNKYGFKQDIVKVTGYSRIDQLINKEIDTKKIIRDYKIPKAQKYVLIAVTWKQDDAGRNIIPFDLDEAEFFMALEELGKRNSALIIFRTHLNSSGMKLEQEKNLKHVHFMPYHQYEVTEEFLALADVLVTDWSSIAFDYLPLRRPTIFMDVTPPFKAGFAIGPEHRFGPVVGNLTKLTEAIDAYINDIDKYRRDYKKNIKEATEIGYGWTIDGRSSERYFERLVSLVNK